ncbi:MAG: FtsX-like permease family protein [Kiritimatiellaeota bacterium]|nr:FtsX-like permease family protein [Kiritimatiellota bacterium]
MKKQSPQGASASSAAGRRRVQRQRQLSFQKAVQIAWRNIRQRLGRSLLVTIGIILALAFLTYILYSDTITRAALRGGSPALLDSLARRGMTTVNDADARIQTRWMLGLALLVSFVGILNSMLLSVTERFKEIGTMKCLGALDSLIVELFLLESTFQGLVGTVAGILIGVALALSEGARVYGAEMWELLPVGALFRLLGICVLVGVGLTVVAALYPAWRAAKMEPVEAMRSEV